MKSRVGVIISACLFAGFAYAQQDDYEAFKREQAQKFGVFAANQQAKYDAYRRELNAEYARFMAESWEKMRAMPAVEIPSEKRVSPVVYEDTMVSSEFIFNYIPILFNREVVEIPDPAPQAEPIAPIEAKDIEHEVVTVAYYGTLVSVPFPMDEVWRVDKISEKELSKLWSRLSESRYDMTIRGALDVRDGLDLCDWGYMQVLESVCEKRYGKGNEAVFMQAYLMAQSGYKVRLAYAGEELYLLVASDYSIVSKPYFVIGGDKFYPMNCTTRELSICKAAFETEKKLSLQIAKEQKLAAEVGDARSLSSQYGIRVEVQQNTNLMDFYEQYPSSYVDGNLYTRWAVYANTPLDGAMAGSLYPSLREAIGGLSERDAVNKLLNFVQTAFEYGYDDEIWGGDRAFFAEETLYYPYADCEDRAVLFSRLVRDLVGLDVVLLYYPGHLAAAVEFNDEVFGDYLVHNQKKYIVCDPTYIGAPVGRTMPNMNNQEAQIIIL
jgi:hypothetical protein